MPAMRAAVVVLAMVLSVGSAAAGPAPGAASARDDDRKVYPYRDAVYHYRLNYGFVFEEPRQVRPRLAAWLAVSPARGSDGVALAELRVSGERLGFELAGRRMESVDPLVLHSTRGGSAITDRSMALWSASLTHRTGLGADTAVRFTAGAAGLDTAGVEHQLGAAAGLWLDHSLTERLRARAGGRFYVFENEGSAGELAVGVRAWFLEVGYRWLELRDLGRLHGPEVGVAFEL